MANQDQVDLLVSNLNGWNRARSHPHGQTADLSNIVIGYLGDSEAEVEIVRNQSIRFDYCNFANSTFRYLDFHPLNITGAVLEKAKFDHCDLDISKFDPAQLSKCIFRNCTIKGDITTQSVVAESSFFDCSFKEARFSNIDFREIEISNWPFEKCTFSGCNLSGMDLENSIFTGSDFVQTSLDNTNFSGCNLETATFNDCDLTTVIAKRADFSSSVFVISSISPGAFQGANWHKSDFRQSDLRNIEFDSFDMVESKFDGTDLSGCIFRGGDFSGATFRDIDFLELDLREGDFSNAKFNGDNKKLSAPQFGGTILLGATLPPDLKDFGALEHVAETSKHARSVFLGLVGACLYTLLTISTTQDAGLLLNSAGTPLPILNAAVPVKSFYLAVPFILLVLYFYLHFYLQTMWEELSGLPAIFEDGRRLDNVAYPWLLTSMVPRYFMYLRGKRLGFSWLKELFSLAAAFCLVPLTIMGIWFKYLPAHDVIGDLVIGLVCVSSTAFGLYAFFKMRVTLTTGEGHAGKERVLVKLAEMILDQKARFLKDYVALVVVACSLIFGAGTLTWFSLTNSEVDTTLAGLVNANLRDRTISVKPAGWIENVTVDADWGYKKELIPQVSGAYWGGKNLRGASAQFVFLVGAKLQRADLAGSKFWQAKLQNVDLDEANIQKTDFSKAWLQGAKLRCVDARGAKFSDARMHNASLKKSDLEGASFVRADLSGVRFQGARVNGADFTGATGLDLKLLAQACVDKVGKPPIGVSLPSIPNCPPDWQKEIYAGPDMSDATKTAKGC